MNKYRICLDWIADDGDVYWKIQKKYFGFLWLSVSPSWSFISRDKAEKILKELTKE